MSEVRYSVNGKYFKDFGTYVSDSDGLFDALKRKKVNSYDWAEYHGDSPDLSDPKFEAREISLKCFVVGANWLEMKTNFDSIIGEFQKPGTQRLLIEPLGLKALPFEVYCDDATPLNKTFREGKTAGTFTLKLIEPNPVKIVLRYVGKSLNLFYTSPKESEIFYGNGLKDTVKTNASITGKPLANRVVSKYEFSGRNKILGAWFYMNQNLEGWNHPNSNYKSADSSASINFVPNTELFYDLSQANIPLSPNRKYTVSFFAKGEIATDVVQVFVVESDGASVPSIKDNYNSFPLTTSFVRHQFVFTTAPNAKVGSLIFRNIVNNNGTIWILEPKLEIGEVFTGFNVAPEDEKYIVIAANVKEITGLSTNADLLWEQL